MRVAEFDAVKDAKRSAHVQFQHYYRVRDKAPTKSSPVSVQETVKKQSRQEKK
jgi:hypothetical protein